MKTDHRDKDQTETTVSRRDFLATAGAAGAVALAPGVLDAASGPVPTANLGTTGARVSVLAAGTAFNLTPIALRSIAREGITYWDTAQSYAGGNSEKEIGKYFAKQGNRKDVYLVTKCGNHAVESFTSALNGSLESLQTDYVDTYFLHNLGDPDRLDDEMKACQEKLKKEGKIRYFGFSSHHGRMIDVLERAPQVGFVDTIMFKYSFRNMDDPRLQKAMDACAEAGIGLIAMKTQGGRQPTDVTVPAWEGYTRHQAALKVVWEDERISAICSEMVNVQQVKDNGAAARLRRGVGYLERQDLQEYAIETNHLHCRGCAHICESRVAAGTAVADLMRLKMYHDEYGKRRYARDLFAQMPVAARQVDGVDFRDAEAACPFGLQVGNMVRDAVSKLA